MSDDFDLRPAGFQRLVRLLAERGYAAAPCWLDTPARP